MRWDIFCTVIDNFGDAGITWRLARQLAAEHGLTVRLWVDDLVSLARLRPEIDPGRAQQSLMGVDVRHWTDPFPDVAPADVVIEALACHLPENYVLAMARRVPAPVWINLEYLSAEDWVEDCHGLPSPHPRLPLVKHFFFPGYTPRTGGLPREDWLEPARQAFLADPEARMEFWRSLNLPPPATDTDEIRISLFGYENSAVTELLTAWADGPGVTRVLLPEGRLLPQVAAWSGANTLNPGETLARGRLTLHVLPMLEQDRYDRLLWACDLNFVRGEDSFARAQWAARPLVWQAYRQEEDAHWPKIQAFLRHYCDTMPEDLRNATTRFWTGWNMESPLAASWAEYRTRLPDLARHATYWRDQLAGLGDLARNLVKFCNKKL